MPIEQMPAFSDFLAKKFIEHSLTKGIFIRGREYIPHEGPAIVALNHMGWLEYPVALLALNEPIFHQERTTTIIKKETVLNPILGRLVKNFNVITIERDTSDRNALHTAVNALQQKLILLTFIEGTRGSKKEGNINELKQGKLGTALIAKKAAIQMGEPVPIYPCSIWGGTETIFPEIDRSFLPWSKKIEFKRQKVYVIFSPPISVLPNSPYDRNDIEIYTTAVMHSIRDNLPEQYHGVYRKY